LTASYELKLREKELKIRYLEAEVDRLKKEKQVPDFGQLVRSFSQEREAANDEVCNA
jgi:hypothetical protein